MKTEMIEKMYVVLNTTGKIENFSPTRKYFDGKVYVKITDEEYEELCYIYNHILNAEVYFNEFGKENQRINLI